MYNYAMILLDEKSYASCLIIQVVLSRCYDESVHALNILQLAMTFTHAPPLLFWYIGRSTSKDYVFEFHMSRVYLHRSNSSVCYTIVSETPSRSIASRHGIWTLRVSILIRSLRAIDNPFRTTRVHRSDHRISCKASSVYEYLEGRYA